MKPMNTTVLFTALLAFLGCATIAPLPDPVELPTLGQLVSKAGDPLPSDQSMAIAKRLRPGVPFQNGNEVSVVTIAKSKDPETGRTRSLAAAINALSPAFYSADLKQQKRIVWWPGVDNETYYTFLCVVPPANASTQKAVSLLPGHPAPASSATEKGPVIVKAAPVIQAPIMALPTNPPAIWAKAAQYKPGDSFAFRKNRCSVGRAEMPRPQALEAAKGDSSFVAASNLIHAVKVEQGVKPYDGDADELLGKAVLKQWRHSEGGMEAVVCIDMPSTASVAAN